MITLIRNQVFETNSSSCHSFTTDNTECLLTTIIPPDNETIVVKFEGEFGWGYDSYTGPLEKLDYICLQYQDSEEMLDLIKRVVEEHTGYNVEFSETRSGYIDHESYGILSCICGDMEGIKNFIFNPNWELIIDNDNH